MSIYDDMAKQAGYEGEEAAQVARRLEEQHRRSCWSCERYGPPHDGTPCGWCGRQDPDET